MHRRNPRMLRVRGALLTLCLSFSSCYTPKNISRRSPERKEENPEQKDQQPPTQQSDQSTSCPKPEQLLRLSQQGISTQDEPLSSLTAAHPRIYVTPQRLAKLKNLIKSGDPILTEWMASLATKVAEIERRPPFIPNSDSSTAARLTSSPEAMDRILHLAGSYLLTGDAQHGRLAIDVMKKAASFSDWHPGHFLDTSVMTYALGLGYDWTYDLLTAEERTAIRAAIVEKGIKPAIQEYARGVWWTKSKDNWPLVNGGAVGVAALAVGDIERDASTTVLRHIVDNIQNPMKNFEPDGGWAEGPMYWGYGSMYLYGLIDAMQTSTGTDFGLSQKAGLSRSGLFRIYTVGTNKKPFSFYDTGEGLGGSDFMMWMARQYQEPQYARSERLFGGLQGPRAILWYAPGCFDGDIKPLPASRSYPRLNLAMLRTAWDDPQGVYVGFKGGDNKTSHGHLDLGGFVLDADGERWAVDLGGDSYTVPGYFDAKIRPTLYRISTQGHNTLTVAQGSQTPLKMPNQIEEAKAPLFAFRGDDTAVQQSVDPVQGLPLPRFFAAADLTSAYGPLLAKAHRGVGIRPDNSILIIDELEARDTPVSVVSHFHTRANITVSGSNATLTQGGKTLRAKIISPAQAHFAVISANPRDTKPDSQENPNRDVKDLIVRLGGPVRSARIVVWLVPGSVVNPDEPQVDAAGSGLVQWAAAAPIQNP